MASKNGASLMSLVSLVLVDAVVWAVWSAIIGIGASRVPADRLWRPPAILTWERNLYERLRIRRWKDRLPEGGSWFGGISKDHLPSSGDVERSLRTFERELWRAESVHWLVLLIGPLFFFFNPWWLGMGMMAYALVANLPCIAVQRFNRARIERALQLHGTHGWSR